MKTPLKYLLLGATFLFLSTKLLMGQEAKPFATYAGTSPCGNILKPFLGVANGP